jgi:hypothetical protein
MANVSYKYIDTAKATDFRVSAVVFVGEKPGTKLPPGMFNRYNERVDNIFISFWFNNSLPLNKGKN